MQEASNRATRTAVDLDAFLTRLRNMLIECSQAILTSSPLPPHWANSCTQLLYTHKSIPPGPEVNDAGKLYISYTEDPDAVLLVGKSKDQRPIKRKLKIHSKRASSFITITSEHVDFTTGKGFTCTGVGQNFKSALDHYFSSSKLDKNYTYKTDSNVQQEGDAFLFPKVITAKGNESWVEDIINAVRKLFLLVSEEKHAALAAAIEKAVSTVDQFLKTGGNENIVNFYDARLWLIVESICEYYDPLACPDALKRKELRDYVIAECCRKLMKEEDMIPGLDSYFQAMNMHQEIRTAEKQVKSEERLRTLLEAYNKDKLYPEVEGHRGKIKDYYERLKKHKKV